jgi:hypothetical protein
VAGRLAGYDHTHRILYLRRNDDFGRHIVSGSPAQDDTVSPQFAKDVAASWRYLNRTQLCSTCQLAPEGRQLAVCGPGNRIFIDSKLGGEEAAYEVAILSWTGTHMPLRSSLASFVKSGLSERISSSEANCAM